MTLVFYLVLEGLGEAKGESGGKKRQNCCQRDAPLTGVLTSRLHKTSFLRPSDTYTLHAAWGCSGTSQLADDDGEEEMRRRAHLEPRAPLQPL